METVLRFFRPLFKLNYKHPYAVVAASILLGVIASFFALQLKVNTDIKNLLPESNPYVQSLEDLQETVGGETEFTVIIESPSFEDNKRFARKLIDQSMELKDPETGMPFFERYSFKRETELLKENALYFATSS